MIDCDLAILAENTRCFFPELSLGLFVTGAVTMLLPRLVGLQKARELILFGERFTAYEAYEMGLAWKVVPDNELETVTRATAERILELPNHAVRSLKRIINRACTLDAEGAMSLETQATVEGFLHPESAERVRRFGSK